MQLHSFCIFGSSPNCIEINGDVFPGRRTPYTIRILTPRQFLRLSVLGIRMVLCQVVSFTSISVRLSVLPVKYSFTSV